MLINQHQVMLHVLRNPQSYGEDTLREMRLKACNELTRLWDLERAVERVAEDMNRITSPQA